VAVDKEQVREHVGAGADQLDECEACLLVVRELLDEHLRDGGADGQVPDHVYDRALLLSAAELFNQGQAPNGVLNQQYDSGDGLGAVTPIRIGADPLRPAYPLVERWVLPAIG
jgi:hypothetical protein